MGTRSIATAVGSEMGAGGPVWTRGTLARACKTPAQMSREPMHNDPIAGP